MSLDRANPPRSALSALGPRRVVVFRALQLGDMLCAVPALRALRAELPRAEIILVSLPWAGAFAEHLPHLVDGFRAFPGYPGLPEQPPDVGALPAFLSSLQAECFDLALQLHGSGLVTNPLTVLLGARRTAGCFIPGQFCPDLDLFTPYPDDAHEVRRVLRPLQALGVPVRGEELEFPVAEHDEQALRRLPGAAELRPGSYVCIHPGARNASRRWPAAQFAAAADALAAEGFRVVVTGSDWEAGLVQSVIDQMRSPAVNLAGHTDLGSMAALLKHAALVLTNNTGVCHLAAAVHVPSVALFHHPSEVRRWAPLDGRRHRVVCDLSPAALAPVLQHARELLHTSPFRPGAPNRGRIEALAADPVRPGSASRG